MSWGNCVHSLLIYSFHHILSTGVRYGHFLFSSTSSIANIKVNHHQLTCYLLITTWNWCYRCRNWLEKCQFNSIDLDIRSFHHLVSIGFFSVLSAISFTHFPHHYRCIIIDQLVERCFSSLICCFTLQCVILSCSSSPTRVTKCHINMLDMSFLGCVMFSTRCFLDPFFSLTTTHHVLKKMLWWISTDVIFISTSIFTLMKTSIDKGFKVFNQSLKLDKPFPILPLLQFCLIVCLDKFSLYKVLVWYSLGKCIYQCLFIFWIFYIYLQQCVIPFMLSIIMVAVLDLSLCTYMCRLILLSIKISLNNIVI